MNHKMLYCILGNSQFVWAINKMRPGALTYRLIKMHLYWNAVHQYLKQLLIQNNFLREREGGFSFRILVMILNEVLATWSIIIGLYL